MGVSTLQRNPNVPLVVRLHRGTGTPLSETDVRDQWHPLYLRHSMADDVERKERLAYAIRAAMARRGLTAPMLAELVGRSSVTVGRWVRGDTAPSALDVGPLANALGVRADYLIDPPAIPEYPLEQYLVETAVQAGLRAGVQRASRPKGEREVS